MITRSLGDRYNRTYIVLCPCDYTIRSTWSSSFAPATVPGRVRPVPRWQRCHCRCRYLWFAGLVGWWVARLLAGAGSLHLLRRCRCRWVAWFARLLELLALLRRLLSLIFCGHSVCSGSQLSLSPTLPLYAPRKSAFSAVFAPPHPYLTTPAPKIVWSGSAAFNRYCTFL